MTSKIHYNEIIDLQVLAVLFTIVMLILLSEINNSLGKFQVFSFAALLIIWLLVFAFCQVKTNGGLLTDMVTVNEQGVVFNTKKDTLSYEWHEVQKIVRICVGNQKRSRYLIFYFILYSNSPVLKKKEITISSSLEFDKYLLQHYPDKIKK